MLAPQAAAPTVPRAVAATTLSAASVALAGSASRSFQRQGTTVQPFRPERTTALVTTGANAITRNPMYVGMAGLLLAHAVRRGSWVALAPVAGFIVLVDRVQIAAEEPALREKFGGEFEAYCARVPRWLDRRSLRPQR